MEAPLCCSKFQGWPVVRSTDRPRKSNMAGFVVLAPPPIAGAVALNWGHGACDLQLSSSVHRAPVLAGGAWPRPLLCCHPEVHVHRFLEDGRPWTHEFVALPARECDASRLLSLQDAGEVIFPDVIRVLMGCGGLPYPVFEEVARTLLVYVRGLAAWALRPGAGPSCTQVRAAIHVSMISEEETEEDGYGGQPSTAAPTETAAMDDQLERGRREGRGEEEEESCAICLERMEGKERCWLPCSHSFHGDCVGRWLRQKAQCPLCRLEVTGPA